MLTGDLPDVELVQARHCIGRHGQPRQVDLLVLHTMESSAKPGTARAVASWFAGPSAPMASAHYCIDTTDGFAAVVQCVLEDDVAYAAPGANATGIHLEHAGRAADPPEVWATPDRRRLLCSSAVLGAGIAARHAIPLVWVSAEELVAGWRAGTPARGVTTHHEITRAGRLGGPGSPWARNDHVDPGGMPVDVWLALARAAAAP